MRVYFFGYMGDGHFWYTPSGRLMREDRDELDRVPRGIDGGFAPRRFREGCFQLRPLVRDPMKCFLEEVPNEMRGRLESATWEYPQGHFLLHQRGEFTLMSWWDRTQGDSRPGCNSNLVAEGKLTSFEMYKLLTKHFNRVAMNLINADVPLVEVTSQ